MLYLFVLFVFTYFVSDTDSLAIATSKTGPIDLDEKGEPISRLQQMESIFLPIVQKDKLEEFKSVWGRWLVLSNSVYDEKKPGLLKSEFTTKTGQMVALCPKNYQIYCRVRGKSDYVV